MTIHEITQKAKRDADNAEAEVAEPGSYELPDELIRVFVTTAPVLIPCMRGTTQPTVPWKELTHETVDEMGDAYLNRLARAIDDGGNIAVKLGPESGDLVAIDIDDDALVEPFLEANPKSRNTFRRQGSKGCQFLYRAVGPYTPEVRNITVNGKRIGEWRGGRCISMIWGAHPKGIRYQWINPGPVIDLEFKDIVWPKDWVLETKKTSGPSNGSDEGALNKRTSSGSGPKIDWDRFNEMVEAKDGGIVKALVEEYFPGAVWKDEDGGRWHCANLTGSEPTNRGSFTIKRNGWCTEWDGSWPGEEGAGILNVTTSEERATASGERQITVEEVFTFLKEQCGEDFFIPALNRPLLKSQLILPCSKYPIIDSARDAFTGLAKTGEYYCYGGAFAELVNGKVTALKPTEFASRLERHFSLVKRVVTQRGIVPADARCTEADAKVLLGTREMKEFSLPLSRISKIPVLVAEGNEPKILHAGYHREYELLVLGDLEIEPMSLEEAKAVLTDGLFADYHFVFPSDLSRAVALLINPAMAIGGLLGTTDYPLDLGIANKSQSGKTHRAKMTAAIYSETPHTISVKTRGVGGLDESIQAALISGKRFILFDNVRGDFDSQTLESILRGSGELEIRLPYRPHQIVSTYGYSFQLTSNEASLTKDLINRALVVNHHKQPADYKPRLPWGDEMIEQINKNRSLYLRAVYAVLSEWIRLGRKQTGETRHDFRKWVGAMDYIITELLRMPKLMEDYDPRSLVDPEVSWLRLVVANLEGEREFSTTDLHFFIESQELEIKTKRGDVVESPLSLGRILTRLFPENGVSLIVEGWAVKRNDDRHKEEKRYHFSPCKIRR